MNKKIITIVILVLFVGAVLLPNINDNIKTNYSVISEDSTKNRIEDVYGLKFVYEGYYIKNHFIEKDTHLVKTSNK